MTDVQVIVLIILLGVVVEGWRFRRDGQVFLGPGLTGGYRLHGPLLGGQEEGLPLHLIPPFPLGPTFRLETGFGPKGMTAADHLDPARTAARLEEVRLAAGRVMAYSRMMFVLLVVLVPFVLLSGRVPNRWLVLGAMLLVLQTALLVEFILAHRKLKPGHTGSMIQHVVMILLFPPNGVFAAESFGGDLGQDVHPLGAALELCPEDEARRVAGSFLRLWGHPVPGMDPEGAAEYREQAEILIHSRGWALSDLLEAPKRDSVATQAYCPRCLAQYLAGATDCPDCPGVGLVPYPDQE